MREAAKGEVPYYSVMLVTIAEGHFTKEEIYSSPNRNAALAFAKTAFPTLRPGQYMEVLESVVVKVFEQDDEQLTML